MIVYVHAPCNAGGCTKPFRGNKSSLEGCEPVQVLKQWQAKWPALQKSFLRYPKRAKMPHKQGGESCMKTRRTMQHRRHFV